MIIPRTEELTQLAARYYCSSYYYRNGIRYCRSTPWSRWGRWVLAGILIFIGLILMFLFLCLARRRRSRATRYQTTQAPMTAPPANGGYYNNNQTYNPPAGPPPPNYGGGYAAENQGYYGQQTGVAQPQGAYVK